MLRNPPTSSKKPVDKGGNNSASAANAHAAKNAKLARAAKAAQGQKDLFAISAAAVGLLVVAIIAVFGYQSKFGDSNTANLSYVELKQTIVNDQGAAARMTVSVQVDVADASWLKENEKALNELFKKELSTLDVATLRSQDGFVEFQNELKRRFNFVYKTDKVQAVMVTDLALQNQNK
jgi:hypothetical protein